MAKDPKIAKAKPASKKISQKNTWKKPTKVRLLTGGNPQIAKGDGDEPVQAYISAMPGWKSSVGKRIDILVEKAVPELKEAVKWNSVFYGAGDRGWFLAMHCYTKRINLGFFKGALLEPLPPGPSKQPDVRYFDILEEDEIDERMLRSWFKQASQVPGWVMNE